MDHLKEMIEYLHNENSENARVNFHSYLQGKMSNLIESYEDQQYITDEMKDV